MVEAGPLGRPGDGLDVPRNVLSMSHYLTLGGRISELTLEIQAPEHPDRPEVRILIDGEDPFVRVASGWRGFDPNDILGSRSPLLPEPDGRRVAVYRCSCGEAGCGSIAPVILSPFDDDVYWLDFRNVVGRFTGPTAEHQDDEDAADPGRPWELPDFRFRRQQYVREIERASADLGWETPRRRTARLLRERLVPLDPVLPPDLRLEWVVPAWDDRGFALSFARVHDGSYEQAVLRLTSRHDDPQPAADEMARRLLATPPSGWRRTFAFD